MAVSRPLLLALIGVLLAAATFVASRNAREATGGDPTPAAKQAKAPSQVTLAPPGSVKSGAFRLTAQIDARGAPRDKSVSVDANGRFQSRGRTEVPAFETRMALRSESQRIRAGAISTGRRGFVIDGGKARELPGRLWSELRSVRTEAPRGGGEPAKPAGLLGPGTDGAVKDFKAKGSGSAGGVASDHYSGTLEPVKLFAALERFAGTSGAALPAGIQQQIAQAVPEVKVDFWVGRKDRIMRRFAADARIKLPESMRQRNPGTKHVDVKLDLELSRVNEPQTVTTPRAAGDLGDRRGDHLSIGTGVLAAGLATIDAPPGAASAGPRRGGARRVPSRPPPAFERAVARGRPLALFVYQPGADDDRRTAEAVAALRRRHVLVFRDRIGNVGRYAQVLQSVNVTQAPSVVIIGPGRKARLVEGFVDPETLAQELVDTTR